MTKTRLYWIEIVKLGYMEILIVKLGDMGIGICNFGYIGMDIYKIRLYWD